MLFLYLFAGALLASGSENTCNFIIPTEQTGVVKSMFDTSELGKQEDFYVKKISIQKDSISVFVGQQGANVNIVFNLYPLCLKKGGAITTKKFAITVDSGKSTHSGQIKKIVSRFVGLVKSRESAWQWKQAKKGVSSKNFGYKIKKELQRIESDMATKPHKGVYHELEKIIKTIPESHIYLSAMTYRLLIKLGHKKEAEAAAQKVINYFTESGLVGKNGNKRDKICFLSMAYAVDNKPEKVKELRKKCIKDEGLQGKDCNFLCAIEVLIAAKRFKTVGRLILLDIDERADVLPENLWKQYIRYSFRVKNSQIPEFLLKKAALRFPDKHWLKRFRRQLAFGNSEQLNEISPETSLLISFIYINLLFFLIAWLLVYNSKLMHRAHTAPGADGRQNNVGV